MKNQARSMNLEDFQKELEAEFKRNRFESPELESAYIVSEITSVPYIELPLNRKRRLTESEIRKGRRFLARRLANEPFQYIFGWTQFRFLDLKIGRGALIPRPETELLAERAIAALREHPHPIALDLCCGSGALAVSMSLEFPGAQVHAADLSPDALAVPAKNAELLGASVTLHQGDLFAAVPEIAFDVIVSNPPYIPSADCLTLQEEVRREPMMALDGGTDGLDFYRRIASDVPNFLRPGGVLLLEVGFDQAEAVMALLADFADVQAHEDYQHIPRMIASTTHF